MQRSIVILIALCTLLAMSGCSKSKSRFLDANKQGEAQGAPAWTLTLRAKCSAAAEDSCIAGYGFSVDANSQYKIGPAPQGHVQTGALTEEEFKAIDSALSLALPNINVDANHAATCNPATEPGDSEDSLVLSRAGLESGILNTSGADICFQTSTQEEAEALHKAIRVLAEKYYALPFPDLCLEASLEVQALYPSYQTCNVDTDCAYANSAYEPIPSGSVQFVVTDNCSLVKPIVVGNIGALVANQATLQKALDHAREVCGQRMVRSDCSGMSGFQSIDAPPVCTRGYCRVNPSFGWF